ncbi:hypothetical protein Pint_21337 [Pistacia integerrima]|uniref:Uncharacterized protein n=1 Tax=Pistacia integerrima TaxID=434235 RepID=A0ACC0XD63_9ROSI|nr:hypothetical protein Pint_21337 [Pistacia integerrima]
MMGLAFRLLFFSSLDFSSPDLETTPVVAKTKLAEATPPDNFTIDFSEYEIRIWGLKKSRMMRMIRLKKITEKKSVIFSLGIGRCGILVQVLLLLTVYVQAFRISFEQSQKKAKQDHDNGKTNGKARESDVIDVEFEEFCKAIEANLSIEQMVEILQVNDQDSSGPNPVVVTKWEMPIVNWNLMVKDPPRREKPVKIPDSVLKSVDSDIYFWTIHYSSLQLRLDSLSNVIFLCIYLSSISLCNS